MRESCSAEEVTFRSCKRPRHHLKDERKDARLSSQASFQKNWETSNKNASNSAQRRRSLSSSRIPNLKRSSRI